MSYDLSPKTLLLYTLASKFFKSKTKKFQLVDRTPDQALLGGTGPPWPFFVSPRFLAGKPALTSDWPSVSPLTSGGWSPAPDSRGGPSVVRAGAPKFVPSGPPVVNSARIVSPVLLRGCRVRMQYSRRPSSSGAGVEQSGMMQICSRRPPPPELQLGWGEIYLG